MKVIEQLKKWQDSGALRQDGELQGTWQELFQQCRSHSFDDWERYLTLLVSTALACGAASVEIERTAATVTVSAPGAYLSKENLQRSFFTLFHSHPERGSELALALLMVAGRGLETATIISRHPQLPSYAWNLDNPDELQEAEEGDAVLEVSLRFDASWTEALSDWVSSLWSEEDSSECLLVEELCRYSSASISIEGREVHAPYTLPDTPIAIERGNSLPFDFKGTAVSRPAAKWSGVIALGEGPLRMVVRGMVFEGPDLSNLSGLIVCDQLQLTLDRSAIVQSDLHTEIIADLEELRTEMWSLLDLSKAGEAWFKEMLGHLVQAEISETAREQLVTRLVQIHEGEVSDGQLPILQFLYRATSDYSKSGEPARLELTAEKAYQRARLLFDDYALNLELIDMCTDLCSWIPARREQGHAWEMLAASRSLKKNNKDAKERLLKLLDKPIAEKGRAIANFGLWALDRGARNSQDYYSAYKAELKSITSQTLRKELEKLRSRDAVVVRSVLASKLQTLASYDGDVYRALETSSNA